MEDINNILNEILDLLGADDNEDVAIPTLYYRKHVLINIDYFLGSDLFKFLKDKFFETCPQYHCSYNNSLYIYAGDIRNWLKEYQLPTP